MKHGMPDDFVNISGVSDEPLWVRRGAVDAIGVRGREDSLVVLSNGMQLIAKSTHPNEVIGLVMGVDSDPES
jgi:hypothetical protein